MQKVSTLIYTSSLLVWTGLQLGPGDTSTTSIFLAGEVWGMVCRLPGLTPRINITIDAGHVEPDSEIEKTNCKTECWYHCRPYSQRGVKVNYLATEASLRPTCIIIKKIQVGGFIKVLLRYIRIYEWIDWIGNSDSCSKGWQSDCTQIAYISNKGGGHARGYISWECAIWREEVLCNAKGCCWTEMFQV